MKYIVQILVIADDVKDPAPRAAYGHEGITSKDLREERVWIDTEWITNYPVMKEVHVLYMARDHSPTEKYRLIQVLED